MHVATLICSNDQDFSRNDKIFYMISMHVDWPVYVIISLLLW